MRIEEATRRLCMYYFVGSMRVEEDKQPYSDGYRYLATALKQVFI